MKGSADGSATVGNLRLVARVAHRRRGYRRLRLLRPDVQRALNRWGYCVTDAYIDQAGVDRLWEVYAQLVDALPDLDPQRFTPINPRRLDAVRPAALAAMDQSLRPALEHLTTSDAQATPSVFQSKPSGPDSAVDPHQDAILVDERTAFGAYAWVPLADVDATSGALYVVPGSHRFGAWQRAPSTGAELEHLRAVIADRARLLPAVAGQVILFDHAAMHGSVPNRSGTTRVAVGGVIRPRYLSTYMGEVTDRTPAGKMELFRHPPASTGLSVGALARHRQHVATVARTELVAGPRAFTTACRLDGMLHPGAPGMRIRPRISVPTRP